MKSPRVVASPYMQFAKANAHVKHNLGSSGVVNYPLSGLPATMADLEITGDSYYGYPPLQEALAAHCGVSSDRVFATIGTSLANHIALASMVEPGDEVVVEQPTYELILSTARYIGAEVKRFPRRVENDFQIDRRDIERTVSPRTKLIVLTNLHNPSSVYTDEATLREIGATARSVGAHVLVDEVYLDAAFDLHPRSSIHLGDEFIVTSSLTKVYGLSGLRCGWVLAHPDLIRRMWHLNDLFEVVPSHPAERLSVIALRHLPAIREWARKLLETNQRLLKEFLDDQPELETVRPGFGMMVFPKLNRGSVEDLYSILHSKFDTTITPGRFFEMPQHFRIGMGCPTETLTTGLKNLQIVLDGRRRE